LLTDWASASYTSARDLSDGAYRVWVKAKNVTGDSE
jgi:hypothetical protein